MPSHTYKWREPGSLKQATAQLIDANGGPQCAAEGCRVTAGMLFKYTDPNDENRLRFMPVDIVRGLEQRCGDPVVTRFLAAEAGHVLIRLDLPDDVAGLPSALAEAAAEASDVYKVAAQCLEDGKVEPGEAAKLVEEIDEAIEAFAAMRTLVARLRRDGEGA